MIQLGVITLIWDLWLSLPPDLNASRTGYFVGMQAPHREAPLQPDLQDYEEPDVALPEPPPVVETDAIEEPDEPVEHREVIEEPEYPEWDGGDLVLVSPEAGLKRIGDPPMRRDRGKQGAPLRYSGSGRVGEAIALGLAWLARHQGRMNAKGRADDGSWDSDGFMRLDPADDRCDGAGGALNDTGVTGLALLAFLGGGHTDRGRARDHPYARNVRMGLRYLLTSQAEDGVFGTRSSHKFMYSHAIATQAMCEAYWMTRNPRYQRPAQEGLDFLAMARNPYMAWRYEPRGGENDTAVTAWAVAALKAGRLAGLEVDPDAFEGARRWLGKITDPNFGQIGYNYPGGAPDRPEGMKDRFPPEKSQSMTAAGMLTRVFLGEDPAESEMLRKGANLCVELPPVWNNDDGSIDMYYWYFGTKALRHMGGNHWRKWKKHMVEAIIDHQHPEGSGSRTGSWDPIGVWGGDGGRIYSTALMTMCLE